MFPLPPTGLAHSLRRWPIVCGPQWCAFGCASEWSARRASDGAAFRLTRTSVISGAGWADPGAAEGIGQGERNHQREPEKSRQDDDSSESVGVQKLHEKQPYQAHFYERNGQRYDGIEWAEVDIGDPGGQGGQHEQGDEYQGIGSNRRALLAHL